eukprot:jgi/Chrzof1/13392/Cz07g31100.t1
MEHFANFGTAEGLWPFSNLCQVIAQSLSRSSSPESSHRSPSELLVINIGSGRPVGEQSPVDTQNAPAAIPSTVAQGGDGPISRALQQLTQRRGSPTGIAAATHGISIASGITAAASGISAAANSFSRVNGSADTPAAAAERHRLTSSQHVDFQALAKWVEQLLPYLILLAVIFCYHFLTGIFLFGWLMCSIFKANQLMRKLVALKKNCQPGEMAAAMLYIATNAVMVVWLSGQKLWRSFLLLPPRSPISVWQAVFLVLVADSLVRFCGLMPKLLVVSVMQSRWAKTSRFCTQRRQARLLTLVEYTLLGYRTLLPVPIWYTYLLTCTLNSVLCSLLAGFYLTFKGYGLLRRGKLLLVAAKLVMRTGALYGRYVNKDDSVEGAAQCCPICQDPAQTPVRLDCSHVFCEDCIGEWLERDQTCPMCRSNVKPPGLQSYSDGATTLLPQIF